MPRAILDEQHKKLQQSSSSKFGRAALDDGDTHTWWTGRHEAQPMKASSCLDRSICGAFLSSRTSSLPSTCRCIHSQSDRGWNRTQGGCRGFITGATDPAAGTLLPLLLPPAKKSTRRLLSICHRIRPTTTTTTTTPKTIPAASRCTFLTTRCQHTAALSAAVAAPHNIPTYSRAVSGATFWQQRRPTPSKQELLSYVDPPPEGDSVDAHLQLIHDPYMRRYAPADSGPEVRVSHVSHVRDYAEFPTWRDVEEQADEAVQQAVRALAEVIWSRLRSPGRTTAAEVYDRYCQLPLPGATRMAHIPASLRHQLLKALGMVEKKDAQSMMRYFAVVADVKDGGFALWLAEWNAALSFAARYVGSSTASETEAAVQLWREMEQDAHIEGNEVTFNILFDVASKAGNFTLAEMVYQEMERRGLRFNRYHHVSLIHFFGLKMDADGVRAAYREMVEAGEMIDVVVLNCVVASFLRCGEEDAAERVYQQMRQSYLRLRKKKADDVDEAASAETNEAEAEAEAEADAIDAAADAATANFASQKAMTQVLMMLAKVSRRNADMRSAFQHLVPTRPDLATYRILINHHAVRLGHLPDVTRYLRDMQTLRIPLHGAVFLALFKGFALHGGPDGSGTDWSLQRLRSIWAALLKALDDEAAGLYVSTWLVVWVLRAFDRCGSPEMVFKAYNSLTSRWEPSEADADFTIGFLHSLLKGKRRNGPGGHRPGGSPGGGEPSMHRLGDLLFE